MGCVQAKPTTSSPKSGASLDKMKLASGYASAMRAAVSRREKPAAAAAVDRARSRGPSAETAAVEREKVAPLPPLAPAVPAAVQARRRAVAGEEEVDDGWPKWLTDNIPREVLAGMVRRSADSYDKLAKVGQGTYSNVYKAWDRKTGKIVALKKVRFDTSEKESVRFMAREIMILQRLDHPNIIKLEGLATSRMQYSLYLVFDFMCTDLSRVISRPEGKLTEPQVKSYMHQLLSGLQHCHERGILHRDIKGSNLLIDKQGRLKIGDFGLANYFDPTKKRPLTSRVVTLWYRAPELLLGTTDYGVGIDLWSAGCLLAEMFAARPIMPGRTEVEQLHRIFKLCGSPPEDYWRKMKLSTSFRPPKPYKPSIVETFKDFPSSSLGLLKSLLALDPAYRGTAYSALQNEFFTTSPLACELSGLPVVYKEEDDEIIQIRRKHRSSKLKQRSRTQKEGQRNVEDITIPKGDSVSAKEEKVGVRATHSHELGTTRNSSGSSALPNKYYSLELGTRTTSPNAPPDKYYAKPPPSLSPANSLHESAGESTAQNLDLVSGITNGYYVSSPPSLSPVSSPLRENTRSRSRNRQEVDIITTRSNSSDEEPDGYTVSPPTTPSPVKSPDTRDRVTTEVHPFATKNIKNLPPRLSTSGSANRANSLRYGMEKRSITISSSRYAEKKPMARRYAVG